MPLPSTCIAIHTFFLHLPRCPPTSTLWALRLAGVVLSDYGSNASRVALPEFVGAGGGNDIFRIPFRTARPTYYRSRCDPTRCRSRRQLQAGTESGVQVWGLDEEFEE
ncbi:hypothetical protein C2845_PM04G17120 [Panicum miliaceum]|uniref:Uncharacterized protein n=1 Tax=Panicum miliaceum TaxID=4540 RepID=A0A3L6QVC9_PANMI|nr:hypothetical protein C2845_PM04G17120 [Panicum miliaceum]